MSGPYLFTADLHLGSLDDAEESRKETAFASLLDHAADRASGLAILGDLFDFWFPYRHAIPRRGIRLLARMAALRDEGFPIRFLGGNHDFWIADYLEEEFGIPAREPTFSLSVENRRIFAAHGDDLVAAGDPGYRFLKALLRNRIARGLYRSLHPDLGIPFARRVSKWSREYTTEKEFHLGDALAASIDAAFDAGHDAVVMGHLHTPRHLTLPRGECVILGGWTGRLSLVSVEEGVLSLGEWPRE